ncbi:MAG: xanthine dehydrogenase family protein molybdopterin-binding subunit [Geminicoccaceae bacterium]|nr:xanthine dehydrogenase family protein molybdopterin-binding subunit [Geminicoccaceae bacterium]
MGIHSTSLKFGVAQAVPRREDPRLLTGGGRYTDDLVLPGTLHAVVVRSPIAHGILRAVDTSEAASAPGVHLVLTGRDLEEAGYGPLPCAIALVSRDGRPMIVPPFPALATDRVRWAGQPIAMVVAETRAQALDAAERVRLEIEPLPAVVDLEAAIRPEAPQLFAEMPGNLAVDWWWGPQEEVERAIAGAAKVVRLRVVNNRVVVNPMEPRGAIASFEDGRYVLRTGCQGVMGLRAQLATVLRCEPERIRVLTEDVGGSFGMKASTFPEHPPLLHAAKLVGRPVAWLNDRSESFLSDYHGRSSILEGELALDARGDFLALRVTGLGELGAYVTAYGPAIPTMVLQKNLASVYRTPLIALRIKGVVTNTTPLTAYRGAGRPEAVYLVERLIEQAARELGRDPIALRRQNLIPRDAFPFTAASGLTYDSGDFAGVLDRALEAADWAGFPARRSESARRGKLRGRGLCAYLEVTAPPGKEHGGIRFAEDGRVILVSGTLDYGQGHRTAFAQILHEKLGVPFDRIELLQGDSDQLLRGGGTGGSRSLMVASKATLEASEQVIAKGKALAAELLEAAEADILFAAGTFTVAGTDRRIGLLDLAARARELGRPLDTDLVSDDPPSAFPNGCHVAEVEIDPETGVVSLLRYTAVDDFGTLVNPLLVEGQVHGGIVQGIGQALLERVVHDASGQLLSGSFMDYALPRAADVPDFALGFHNVPATTNPLGVKGCGEAGVTAAPAAIVNAVLDALAAHGVHHLDMPLTPERVWRSLRTAASPRRTG